MRTDGSIEPYNAPKLPSGQPRLGCWLTGPGRGDCLNSVGVPVVLDETTRDSLGLPHGWCWWCWHQQLVNTFQGRTNDWRDWVRFMFTYLSTEDIAGMSDAELQRVVAAAADANRESHG